MLDSKRSFLAIALLGCVIAACNVRFNGSTSGSLPRLLCGDDAIGDASTSDAVSDAADGLTILDATSAADASDGSEDARRDTGVRDTTTVLDPPPTDPFVTILSGSSCNGRRLSQSNAFTEYARLGFEVWHLCYETPASVDGAVDASRPSRVSLFHFDPSSLSLVEDATLIAPREGDPWTGNVMIAGAVLFVPYFGLSMVRGTSSVSWAVSQNDRGRFSLVGQLRLWRINADGTQESSRVHFLCRPPDSPSSSTIGFVVPEAACPSDRTAADCGLSEFVCQTF